HLVGVVGTAGGHDHVGTDRMGIVGKKFGGGVGQGEDQGPGRHAPEHLRLEHAARRQAEKYVGVVDDVAEGARVGFLSEAFLHFVHEHGPAFVDHALDVRHPDVFQGQPHVDHEIETGQGRRARARHHHFDLVDFLADHFQAIDEGRGHADGGAVLVVVEDRYLHAFAQRALDVEAFRRLDVFKIDAAESGFQTSNDLHQLFGILFVDLDVEDVNAGELL